MKKYRSIKKFAALFVAIILLFSVTYTLSDEDKNASVKPEMFFDDVSPEKWYYQAANELGVLGVIPEESNFNGEALATRGDIVLYLYNLGTVLKIEYPSYNEVPFADVTEQDDIYDAICWAYNNGVVSGYPDGTFSADGECTREQLCTMIVRFLSASDIQVCVKGNSNPFADSMSVSKFARSYVVAAKLAGIINGNEGGYVNPQNSLTRAELAQVVYNVYKIASITIDETQEAVNLTPNAYDDCYIEYERLAREAYDPRVKESAPVDLSYFDDAVFVGDSVTMSLQFYCAATGALGKAKFLCAGSLSPSNALWEISDESVHPVYGGQKVFVEDGIKRMGAKKVYIMLGINGLNPVDSGIANMKILIDRILAKSPDAKIILQSVTPMTKDSPIKGGKFNNTTINQYNEELCKLAKENGWFYINVAEVVTDKNGNLRDDYCSDPQKMGIHFNYTADKQWVDYLITHAPNI